MPDEIYDFVMAHIPDDLKQIVETFEQRYAL